MHCAEYKDLVAAHVDGLLSAEEHPLAAAHVAACPRCARLLADAQQLKRACAAYSWVRPTPDDTRTRVLQAIDTAAAQPSSVRTTGRRRWRWRWYHLALAGAAAVLVAAIVTPLLRSGAPTNPLLQMVADYQAAEAQAVHLDFRTSDPQALRAYYHRTGAFDFTDTVVDLKPNGYEVVGGAVTRLGRQNSTLTLYRSRHGLLVCHRIRNIGMTPPPGGEAVGGDAFYNIDGISICFHREGDVICFMAARMPLPDFIKRMTGRV